MLPMVVDMARSVVTPSATLAGTCKPDIRKWESVKSAFHLQLCNPARRKTMTRQRSWSTERRWWRYRRRAPWRRPGPPWDSCRSRWRWRRRISCWRSSPSWTLRADSGWRQTGELPHPSRYRPGHPQSSRLQFWTVMRIRDFDSKKFFFFLFRLSVNGECSWRGFLLCSPQWCNWYRKWNPL